MINPIIVIIFLALILVAVLILFYIQRSKYKKDLRAILKDINQLRKKHYVHAELSKPEGNLVAEINQSLNELNEDHALEFEKLKNVDSYRKEFLGNVSHELKTPIFAVEGYIHTLLDGGIDDPDINIVYLQKATKSLDRLTSMVSDLESISRMESGEMIIDWRTFNITDLIYEVVDTHMLRASEKNIRLIAGIPVQQQIYVYADKERIRQVFDNLLVNSIKYGKQNGTTEISFSETESAFFFHVKDDGIGLDEKHLPRLFERFYRADKHRSRNEGGTGLGLAIVKHIIESHQQRITVQSKLNEGTVFSFSLMKSI